MCYYLRICRLGIKKNLFFPIPFCCPSLVEIICRAVPVIGRPGLRLLLGSLFVWDASWLPPAPVVCLACLPVFVNCEGWSKENRYKKIVYNQLKSQRVKSVRCHCSHYQHSVKCVSFLDPPSQRSGQTLVRAAHARSLF